MGTCWSKIIPISSALSSSVSSWSASGSPVSQMDASVMAAILLPSASQRIEPPPAWSGSNGGGSTMPIDNAGSAVKNRKEASRPAEVTSRSAQARCERFVPLRGRLGWMHPPALLVHDVLGSRFERQHLIWAHQPTVIASVLGEEQLEARVYELRCGFVHQAVGLDLLTGRPQPVDGLDQRDTLMISKS